MTTPPSGMTVEEIQSVRSVSAQLQRDFDGIFSVETIERVMTDSFDDWPTRASARTFRCWLNASPATGSARPARSKERL